MPKTRLQHAQHDAEHWREKAAESDRAYQSWRDLAKSYAKQFEIYEDMRHSTVLNHDEKVVYNLKLDNEKLKTEIQDLAAKLSRVEENVLTKSAEITEKLEDRIVVLQKENARLNQRLSSGALEMDALRKKLTAQSDEMSDMVDHYNRAEMERQHEDFAREQMDEQFKTYCDSREAEINARLASLKKYEEGLVRAGAVVGLPFVGLE